MDSPQASAVSDEEIVRLMQSPDEADLRPGMELLVQVYGEKIASAVRFFSPGVDHHGRQDIQQEALLRIRKNLRERYRHHGKLWAYLKRIVRGVSIDYYRQKARVDRRTLIMGAGSGSGDDIPEPASPRDDQPDHQAIRHELIRSVRQELTRLQPRCREIIRLHYQDELKYQEIAETLGIAVGTVSSRLARCLEQLGKGLNNV